MANKHLKHTPHKVAKTRECWWYEDLAGIEVVVDHGMDRVSIYKISWRAIRAALARKDKQE